ncbi:conserved hypothetical protein [Echinococcus multilocularis]|uniref:Uncharacterized protein n=1 Tax=Echinococcus multilocularis TaxID=6211 RepID=A0A068XYL9_ECHMU|nr:conserved hypothetical protein [Echinococcus multilocularis]
MGSKESHLQTSASKRCGSVHGQISANSYLQFANNTCQTISSTLNDHDTFKYPKTNSSDGRTNLELSNRNFGGDVCSCEPSLCNTKLDYKSCDHETGAKESHDRKTLNHCSRGEISGHLSNEKVDDILSIISNESDTSSSISVGDGSAEAILNKLKNRRKTSKTVFKKKNQEVGSHSSGGHSCISQISSSSSPPSCCTPVPFVNLVKFKKTGKENKVAQQEQTHNPGNPVALTCELSGSFNANISNKQSSGDLPDQIPGTHGDEMETRNGTSSSQPFNTSPLDSEEFANRWVTPKPSPKLGFTETDAGDIILTAYLRMKGTGPDEYAYVKKTSERRLRGLQTQQNCKIKLYDEPTEQRTLMVHKLRIFGSSYREVVRCKNSLPRCITDRLITAHASLDEILIKPQRRL